MNGSVIGGIPVSAKRRGYALTAGVLLVMMLGGTLPVPLYVLWEKQMGFGPLGVTVVFAAYVVGTLAALLVLGDLSDHVGRRIVLAIAVACAAVSTALFLAATGIGLLIVARVVSGLAAGLATGTATATVTDVSAELKVTTCRTCRSQLGLDNSDEANGRLEALFVISITLGLRPGELRMLTWDHVDLSRGVIHVWRSASQSGDTKTPKSKRSLELPKRAVVALTGRKARQAKERQAAREAWHDNNLVFCHENGNAYTSDQLNWRFGKMTRRAGIGRWHAHEGRHTAVSIMSSNGVPIQEISDAAGHKSTHVTETVCRHVIVPEIRGGATVMDGVFDDDEDDTDEGGEEAETS